MEKNILRGEEGFVQFNNMLERLPLHLKRLLQCSIGSLRIHLAILNPLIPFLF